MVFRAATILSHEGSGSLRSQVSIEWSVRSLQVPYCCSIWISVESSMFSCTDMAFTWLQGSLLRTAAISLSWGRSDMAPLLASYIIADLEWDWETQHRHAVPCYWVSLPRHHVTIPKSEVREGHLPRRLDLRLLFLPLLGSERASYAQLSTWSQPAGRGSASTSQNDVTFAFIYIAWSWRADWQPIDIHSCLTTIYTTRKFDPKCPVHTLQKIPWLLIENNYVDNRDSGTGRG